MFNWNKFVSHTYTKLSLKQTVVQSKLMMGKVFNQIRNSFQTFCNRTSLHCFFELFHAKSVYWEIFWVFLLSSAIGLSTYQVILAVNQFMDQPTSSRMQQLEHYDMYPPIKLCSMHWVYWLDWKKAVSLNFSKESILYGMSYLSDIYIEDSFNVENAKLQFHDAMALNNFTKMQQFYLSVAKEYYIDETHPLTPTSAFGQPQLDIKRYWGPLVCYMITGETILETVRKNTNNITSYIELFLPVKFQRISWNDSNITLREFVWYMTQFLKSLNIYTGSYIDHSIKDLATFNLPFLLYVDGFGQDYVPIHDDKDLYTVVVSLAINRWLPNLSYKCLVGQKFIASNLSLCGPPCSTKYPDFVCKCMNIKQAILSNTDDPSTLCQNKIFRMNNETVSEISPENLITKSEECWENKIGKQLQQSCHISHSCPCEQWSYTFTFLEEKFGTMLFQSFLTKTSTSVRVIYPQRYNVFVMVEIESQSWEDFVANIGGLLGVWTGASLLSIVQLVYLCCFSDIEKPKVFLQADQGQFHMK